MKKNFLSFLLMLSAMSWTFAQTAPDFTATDCDGNSHNLYTELAQGKVIVLCWVMPCGACIGPALTAYNIVQSYASPDVLYYLIDDFANTTCNSLSGWATNNNIGTNRETFSTSAIVEANYGGNGMPHVAVVGPNGHMYFNGLNAAAGNSTAIQNAIDAAITATGIIDPAIKNHPFTVASYSSGNIEISYSLTESANIYLEVINEAGQSVLTSEMGKQSAGIYKQVLDVAGIAKGVYFFRLHTGSLTQVVKYTLAQ